MKNSRHDARTRAAEIVGFDRAMMQDGVRNWPEHDLGAAIRRGIDRGLQPYQVAERMVIGVHMDMGRQLGHRVRRQVERARER